MQANTDKPAYVRFEIRSTEDRNASMAQGHTAYKDTVYALITPQGSKDQIERIAEDWIEQNKAHVMEGRMPENWAQAYKAAFEAFKEGRELPPEGTPILTWTAVSPAQQKAILDANIRTVEDLANANEAALVYIGIGGRMLKQRAQAYLDSANDTGKVAAELEQLRQFRLEAQETMKDLQKSNLELVQKLENVQKVDA